MFNTFFDKGTREFVWLLDLYTENTESSSKQLELEVSSSVLKPLIAYGIA